MTVVAFVGGVAAIGAAITLSILANVYPDNKASITCEDQKIQYGEPIDLTKIHIRKTSVIYNVFKPSVDVDPAEATIVYNAETIGVQNAIVDYHGCVGEFSLTITALKLDTPAIQINIGQYIDTYDIVVTGVENADYYTLTVNEYVGSECSTDTFTLGTNLTKEVEVTNDVTKIKASVVAKSNSSCYSESEVAIAERNLK